MRYIWLYLGVAAAKLKNALRTPKYVNLWHVITQSASIWGRLAHLAGNGLSGSAVHLRQSLRPQALKKYLAKRERPKQQIEKRNSWSPIAFFFWPVKWLT